jgi:hypothetical protein
LSLRPHHPMFEPQAVSRKTEETGWSSLRWRGARCGCSSQRLVRCAGRRRDSHAPQSTQLPLLSFFPSQSIDLGTKQLAPLRLRKKFRACLSLDAEQARHIQNTGFSSSKTKYRLFMLYICMYLVSSSRMCYTGII